MGLCQAEAERQSNYTLVSTMAGAACLHLFLFAQLEISFQTSLSRSLSLRILMLMTAEVSLLSRQGFQQLFSLPQLIVFKLMHSHAGHIPDGTGVQ